MIINARDLVLNPGKPAMPTSDDLHEARIQAAYDEWLEHSRERPGLWTRLVDLIAQRSPEQVERMERRLGLAH